MTDRASPHSDILKIILAVILPPLGVLLERGCGADLLINILLTVLGTSYTFPGIRRDLGFRGFPRNPDTISPLTVQSGYLPGIIHALYIILKY